MTKLICKIIVVVAALGMAWFCYESFEQLVLDGDCIELYLPVKEHLQLCKD